jgi:NAD-dependent deacetylase
MCGLFLLSDKESMMNQGQPFPQAREVAALIGASKNTVAFTGAGISTGAGIPDFRGKKGIYATGQYPPNIFDIEAFVKNPKIFYAYGRDFLEQEKHIRPTFTHSFLSALEHCGRLSRVITQNIDGLHQKAGTGSVIEMHGGYGRSHCLSCGQEYGLAKLRAKVEQDWVPRCDSCRGVIKPDIVFFGEPVRGFEDAEAAVARCELLLVIGTSLTVHPAAFLPQYARGKIVVVNKGSVHMDNDRAVIVDEDIDAFFRQVAERLSKEITGFTVV